MAEIATEAPAARDYRELKAWLIGLAQGVLLAFMVLAVVDEKSSPLADRHMSAKERVTGIVLTEATNVIEVRFESSAEILARLPSARAVSMVPLSGPCRVYLPTGMPIGFDPSTKHADWLDADDANTVAHEFLHCLRGGWHER